MYESFQQEKDANIKSAYDTKLSNFKLAGFKVKAHDDVDTKHLKNLLLRVYNDVDNISEIVAEKPSFEVSYAFPFLKELLQSTATYVFQICRLALA